MNYFSELWLYLEQNAFTRLEDLLPDFLNNLLILMRGILL